MQPAFGAFRVRIDPWEVDYGDQTPLAPQEEAQPVSVDHAVEFDDANWRPIQPPPELTLHQRVVFIDGVRRLEARVHARQGDQLIYGGFGSFAVGATVLGRSTAIFESPRVFRTVVLGSGQRLPGVVRVRPNLEYSPESTPNNEVDAPLRHIQKSMRHAEATLARDSCREETLTIVDGPLSFEPERRGLALGYVKRIHELYIPSKFLLLLATLRAGNRTPLFAITSVKSGFARFSWFQRLADPNPGATEMHGLVRLEVSANVGVERAVKLANAATSWLPRTAPSRGRDPRSPQNLLPIGALEQRLRIALGDARLIRRWIEDLIATEASHA
jgi:uncharacterized protein